MVTSNEQQKQFSPLLFLAALGAGGISVIPFAFLQYTYHTGKGLVTYNDIMHSTLSAGQEILFRVLEVVMIVFAIIHVALLVKYVKRMIPWMKTRTFKEVFHNPLKNSTLVAPFIAIAMFLNVIIGPARFFIPMISENFQTLMLPALIVWGIIVVTLLLVETKLLTISFTKGYDIEKINFGWLLHPFALGMVSVTGTGIAAMAKDSSIAHTAAFFSTITGIMGLFLLTVKLLVLFQRHFKMKGLPEKQFLPSFLIVIPNITLYAIAAFRFGHYLEHQFSFHLGGAYFFIVIMMAFAFEVWYLLFGLGLLRNYFKKQYFKKEFYPSQWGLVCPFVAFAVLGSFVYKLFVPSPIIITLVLISAGVAIAFFTDLYFRQRKCFKQKEGYSCS